MESRLERENGLVLDLVQAALGLVSPQLRGIAISLDPDQVVLHVAVHERTAQVEEDVEDLAFELAALQVRPITVRPSIFVGAPDDGWPGRSCRLVYVAKGPEH